MRRRRIKEDHGRVSLFPFLAVLICTMGALLVLLVVISKRAQATAQAERAAAAAESAGPAATAQDAPAKRAALMAEVQQLEQLQAEAKQALADRRDALSHLEDHTRRLNEERARLIQAAERLEREGGLDDEDLERLQSELQRVRKQLADAQQLLAAATEQAGAQPPSFAIIPFDGQNRTHRRPIYLECRADSVVLQPEGIVLEDRDFEGDLQADNPLAAALRATGEYLARSRPNEIGQIGRPYPLLIVKPSSIKKYYQARAAMEAWKDEFGYEMVNEDWEVAFPPPDPQLAQVIQNAVDVARRRQKLHQIASESMTRELAVRSGPVDEGPQNGPGFGRFIPAKKSSTGEGNGSHSGGHGQGENGHSGSANGESAHGGSAHGGSAHGGSAHGGSAHGGIGGGSQASSPSAPYSSPAPGQGPGSGLAGQTQLSGLTQPGGALLPQPFGTGLSSGSQQGSGPQQSTNSLRPLGSPSPSSTQSLAAGQPLGSTQPAGPPQPAGSPPPLGSWQPGGSPQPPVQPGQTATTVPRDVNQAGNSPRPAGSGSGSSPGSCQTVNPQKQESIAEMRGDNWALPGASRGLVAVTRQVRVECLPDRLVIVGRDGRSSQQVIALPGSTRQEVETFVSAVWEYMESWGIAGRGMYWKPVLDVYVRPGAEQRAGELKQLLDESGLEINLLR